jgi:arsenate reductase-like glutaredoxin family protein
MDVQIFGRQKCHDTQKALRFFKERRIKVHLVDLDKRPASAGELRRFVQRFGLEGVLDREGKQFRERGLHAGALSEARLLLLLEEDPLLLRTPLVRSGNRLAIGAAPTDWSAMIEAGST